MTKNYYSLLEKVMVKFLGKTKGYDFNMWDWDSASLFEHWRSGTPLTRPEQHAMNFFLEIGATFDVWHPVEKWKKPYGDVLNETRKLH